MAERTRIAEIEEHKVRTGETLASLAAPTGMTEQELAEFNWGTSDPGRVNEHLRDDVGCTRRDAQGDFLLDNNDEPGIVLIPQTFARAGLSTDTRHTIRVRPLSPQQNLHECICIPGITFAFDKSFIRPSIADHMVKVDAAFRRFPDAKVIVFGHTDRVGGEQYNKQLSERRARSAYAFVTDQPAIWEELYHQENWGLAVIQEILKDLGHNPGAIDGIMGSNTEAAMRSFDGLPEGAPVSNDSAFRDRLFTAYMTGKHDVHVDDAQFFPPKFMGCGEFNPVVEPNANELANGGKGRAPGNEPNRRVVFYLFERPPKTIPCKLNDTGPCHDEIAKPDKRANPLHTCAFYDRMAFQCDCEQKKFRPVIGDVGVIFMEIRNERGQERITGRSYRIVREDAEDDERKGTLNKDGRLRHEDVPPGAYLLIVDGAEQCGALVLDKNDSQPQVRYLKEG